MKHIIIAFKSRNELYEFAKILKYNGILTNIINSPSNISSSCTLSIKADYKYFNPVSKLILSIRPKSFLGLYLLTRNGVSNQTQRLL